MTDFRALCAKLIDAIDHFPGWIPPGKRPVIARARAALAEPEPEGLTDEELDAKWGLPAGTVASWGPKPPPDVASAISRQLDRDIARAAMRPNPPSLKEQALANTNAILNDPSRALLTEVRETLELNRRALEQLPND